MSRKFAEFAKSPRGPIRGSEGFAEPWLNLENERVTWGFICGQGGLR